MSGQMTDDKSAASAANTQSSVSHTQAYLLISLAVFLWAVGTVIARGIHEEVPLIGLSFWRWLVASAVMLPFVGRELYYKWELVRQHLWILVSQGIIIVGSGALLFVGVMFTTAINAVLINAAQPVLTVMLAWIVLGDRLNKIQLLGIVSAVIGVGIMIIKADFQVLSDFEFNVGDLLVILAVMGYATYAIRIRKLPQGLGTFASLTVILFCGSLFLLPVYVAEAVYIKPLPFSGYVVFLVVLMALGISIASMASWNKGNSIVGPSRAAAFVNLLPVYGAILAILFLDEELFLYHIFGAVLVCAGIFMVVRHR